MKQILLACLFIALIGCKKEPDPVPETAQLFDVTFSVSDFDVDVQDYQRQIESQYNDYDVLTDMCFLVYDEAGKLVFYQNIPKNWPAFENIFYDEVHLLLSPGDYKLIAVSAQGPIRFIDSAKYSTAYLVPGRRELFYKEHGFQVIDKNVIDSIELDRINSILEFQLTETFNFAATGMYFNYGSVSEFPLDPSNDHVVDWYRLPLVSGEFAQYETKELVFSGYIIPDRSGSYDPQVDVTVLGPRSHADGFLIEDLIVPPNKKVIVKGSVTGGGPYYNIYASIDSAYSDTTYVDLKLGR